MFKNILNTLTCPYCGSKFELEQVLTENNEEIINGIVKCERRRYPIVEGILVLRIDEQLDYTIKLLKKEKNYDALLTLLKSGRDRKLSSLLQLQKANIPFFNFFNKLFLYYKKIIFRSFFKNKKMTFCQTVDTWKYGLWGDYLKHRFSNPTFLANLPLINMIKEPEKNVLDLGCGTGHTSFVISKFVPERNIICADREFVNLFSDLRTFIFLKQVKK